MIKNLAKEEWKQVKLPSGLKKKYAVSNMGRLASYEKNVNEDGNLIKGGKVQGYPAVNLKAGDAYVNFFVHRKIAELFIGKPTKVQRFCIHKDRNKENNKVANLKWVNTTEFFTFWKQSPNVIQSIENRRGKGLKLTEAKVRKIKVQLDNPKRKIKLKDLAAQFNISEMQLYRIKSGENWGWMK